LYREPSLPVRPEAAPPPVAIQSDSVRRRMSSPLLGAVKASATKAETPPTEPPRRRAENASKTQGQALEQPVASTSGPQPLRAKQLFILGKRLYKADSLPRASRMFASAAELHPE